jgi:hypothetical protein
MERKFFGERGVNRNGISVCCAAAFALMDRPMKDLSDVEPPKQRQMVRKRFLWFLAGAGVNYLLISTP